jgi:ABC-type Zn uptake system ZnuABC Zn-binding protein ZnuA
MKRIAACIALMLFACGTAPQKQSRVNIVTTIGVLADWARNVGGDRVQVVSLLTGNESPHTYDVKPGDVKTIAAARVLFRVGLGLEEWLDPVVQNSGNSRLVVVDASARAADVLAGDGEHKAGNPHIWLDPELAKTSISNLVNELSRIDPAGETLYRQRASGYFRRLDSLSEAIKRAAAGLEDRRFISYHDAWPYFARRFGFSVVASLEPVPGQEPSAKEVAGLVELVRRSGVKVVTSEPQLPSALPDMLAKETGVKVLVLNPLCVGADGRADYIAGLGRNAGALIEALK